VEGANGCACLEAHPENYLSSPPGEEEGMAKGRGPGTLSTNNLEACGCRYGKPPFKKAPRLLVAAQGMHYRDADGRQIPRRHRGTVVRQRGTGGCGSPTQFVAS